ncbi:MAG: amino acid-binding protein [Bacteroidales bacterium]|nr:amino acid-binding protein [Bacteroidales bacterium]
MTIQQISVFVENKPGSLVKVLDVLKQAGIQIIASTIADTVDAGIYRIICSEPAKAYLALHNAGFSAMLTDVLALVLDNEVGRAADTLRILTESGVNVAYLYSFMLGGKGILIIRANDADRARELIMQNNLNFVAEKDLSGWV